MLVKIATIAFTAFIAIVAADEVWDGFVASWDRDTSKHFYALPQTYTAAESEGWTIISGVDPPEGVTALGLQGDPTFVILFANDKPVGFQISIRASDLNPQQPLKWDELDPIIPKTINGELYYTGTAYFSNDESTGVRKLWFQEKDGYREIPTKASLVLSETQYLLKKCILTMGVHYYTWYESSDCTTLYPWFLMAQDDDITGVGLQGFGNLPQIGSRTWWETIPDGGIYAAMSDPPQCVVDGITEFGTISLHVWFVDKPQAVTCP